MSTKRMEGSLGLIFSINRFDNVRLGLESGSGLIKWSTVSTIGMGMLGKGLRQVCRKLHLRHLCWRRVQR
ncbi:hypothetical protein S83_060129 [Arachis hypogaea]